MKPSTLATTLLAASWSTTLVSAKPAVRRNLQTPTPAPAPETCDCCTSQQEANSLISHAMTACGSATAGLPETGAEPNPTCLLLLCTAYTQAYDILTTAKCPVTETEPSRSLYCELTPGLLPPEDPQVFDKVISYDFVDFQEPLCIDVLSDAKFQFGRELEVTAVDSLKRGNEYQRPGACTINDKGEVCWTPPPLSGLDTCEYEACYVGRYSHQCDTALVKVVDPLNPPTVSPTQSPTPTPCQLNGMLSTTEKRQTRDEECSQRPTKLTLEYTAGSCADSVNTQGPTGKFTCYEYEGGPTDSAYITITDKEYTELAVSAGDSFNIAEGGSNLSSEYTIHVYADNTKAKLLQEVTFHTSCSKPLFINDTFGAVKALGWVNEDQGSYYAYVRTTLKLKLKNEGDEMVKIFDGNVLPDGQGVYPAGLINATFAIGQQRIGNVKFTYDAFSKPVTATTNTFADADNGAACIDTSEVTF